MTFGRRTVYYNPTNKNKMWRIFNKIKRLQIVGSCHGLTLPRAWLKAFDWRRGDFMMITANMQDETIIIRKAKEGEFAFEKVNEPESGGH